MPNFRAGRTITDTAQIVDGVVATADIAADAITKEKIAADQVEASEIATGAVGTAEIADGGIGNNDIAAGAGIVDTKLAQIATAGKVSGAALTTLASIPAGAGVIPSANVPSAGKLIMGWHAGVAHAPTNGTTEYVAPYQDEAPTTAARTGLIMPFAGTFKNLYFRVIGSSGGQYITVTVQKNDTDTIITKTSTAGTANETVSDTVNTVAFVTGDIIRFTILANGTPTLGSISIEYSF